MTGLLEGPEPGKGRRERHELRNPDRKGPAWLGIFVGGRCGEASWGTLERRARFARFCVGSFQKREGEKRTEAKRGHSPNGCKVHSVKEKFGVGEKDSKVRRLSSNGLLQRWRFKGKRYSLNTLTLNSAGEDPLKILQ